MDDRRDGLGAVPSVQTGDRAGPVAACACRSAAVYAFADSMSCMPSGADAKSGLIESM